MCSKTYPDYGTPAVALPRSRYRFILGFDFKLYATMV